MTILPLELRDVALRMDGHELLHGLSIDIAAGSRTVILGPNGAGKSLLLRICHGLMPPSAGTVRWTGPDADHSRRRQAMVFQRPVMLRRSVQANVGYALRLHRVPPEARRARVAETLDRTGLADLAGRPATVLSAGEQQRLALARAWALDPEVLFLDEPTASLDPSATASVEAIIGDMREAGCKIVLTTHDLGQARRLADEVIFLHRGRVTDRLDAAAFFGGATSDAAAAFVEGRLHW